MNFWRYIKQHPEAFVTELNQYLVSREMFDTFAQHATRAEWRVQMFRPFWSPFLIIDLPEDYRYTVIGVPNMKFVWIMSRTPSINDADYEDILAKLKIRGYRTDKIVKMPQIW